MPHQKMTGFCDGGITGPHGDPQDGAAIFDKLNKGEMAMGFDVTFDDEYHNHYRLHEEYKEINGRAACYVYRMDGLPVP